MVWYEIAVISFRCAVHKLQNPIDVLINELPRRKRRGIEHPNRETYRGKPRGIEPEEIEAGESFGLAFPSRQAKKSNILFVPKHDATARDWYNANVWLRSLSNIRPIA